MILNGSTEVADPEHVCPSCLPIFGDEIIGTRPHGMNSDDFVTTVHRCSCEIVLKAKNESRNRPSVVQESIPTADNNNILNGSALRRNGRRIKSSLKARLQRLAKFNNANGYSLGFGGGVKKSNNMNQAASSQKDELTPYYVNDVKSLELVDIAWDASYTLGEKILFLTEISLICEDRKLLLADCSEVVSDMSEIVKTGSISTKEHAILNFLVKVESLDHLQKLMNSLREIPSVMSVERNVSGMWIF